MSEKPPVLSEDELKERAVKFFREEKHMEVSPENMDLDFLKQELNHQFDADVEWYEGKIIETVKNDADRCAAYLSSARYEIVNELLLWVDKYRKKYAEEKQKCSTDIQKQANLGGKLKGLANVKSKLISILESKVRPEQRRTFAIERNAGLMHSLYKQEKRVAIQQARQEAKEQYNKELGKEMDRAFRNSEVALDKAVQQARQETAREIFVELQNPCPHGLIYKAKMDCGLCYNSLKSKYLEDK